MRNIFHSTWQVTILSSRELDLEKPTLFKALTDCDKFLCTCILYYIPNSTPKISFKFLYTVFPRIFPRKLFFLDFNLMYCDLWSHYIQVQKLFKGGNYSRAETIRGNTVCIYYSIWKSEKRVHAYSGVLKKHVGREVYRN